MANELTSIILLNTPLNNDYQHTYYFGSKTQQLTYFKNHFSVMKVYNYCSYQRKEKRICVPDHIDNLSNYNYVLYNNQDSTSKYYFAFITKMEYVNSECTNIYIEIDVIQTYMFDYQVGMSFVEREHVNDDTIGKHTIPENLETGEYICYWHEQDNRLKEYRYCVNVTQWTNGSKPAAINCGGIPLAGGLYVFDTLSKFISVIQEYSNNGVNDAIVSAFILPNVIVPTDETETMKYKGATEPTTYEHYISGTNILDGEYIPKNNKLLTFPYQYLLVSNNAGTSNILRYEDFTNPMKPTFEIHGVPCIGGSIKLIPKQYKGIHLNHEEGIMCGKFPVLSWSADEFTNWLTQNSVNIGIGLASAGLSLAGGIVSLAVPGANALVSGGLITGGVAGITNTLTQIHQQSFTPNSARGNVNGGDINGAGKTNTFHFYQMGIKNEYAKIIDRYFDMYGYKVNELKVPNSNHRANYWFTKTIDANITGPIPKEELTKIINAYNNGITFWKPGNFRNYSVDNAIV